MNGATRLVRHAWSRCRLDSTASIINCSERAASSTTTGSCRSIRTQAGNRDTAFGFGSQARESREQQQRPWTSTSSREIRATGQPNGFIPIPYVQTMEGGVHHSTDLFSRLLKERILLCYGPIEDRMAATITSSLLFLEAESDAPISMYINSPGGSVSAGLSIVDTMSYITAPVHTIILGQAASMGSLIACVGERGKRYALPNATIMMHQPSGGYEGTSADIQIHAKEILRIRDVLNRIYHRHLNEKSVVERRQGQEMSIQDIEKLMDRDRFMDAEEARSIGVIDEVLQSRKKSTNEEEKS